jgi:ADP-heptose:LPS heptosyltransferase
LIKTDCRHYRGDKPCPYGYPCDACGRYDPVASRVLVLKCRAQGDVLRTTALLPGLKRKYPGSLLTWLVDPESLELVSNNPLIDRLLPLNLEGLLPLQAERFDVLVCLDKEPAVAALAATLRADRKFGFGLDEAGRLSILNPAADYAWRLGMDDELKFRTNTKSYQEIAAEAAEVDYRRDEYVYDLPEGAGAKAGAFFRKQRVPGGRVNIGLNTGSGSKFETKQWPAGHFLKLIGLLAATRKANLFLLGGPREKAFNAALERRAAGRVRNTGTDNTLTEFGGFLALMDVVVCSDTLAMHMAIGLKKRVVALFGPTTPAEIDLYDRGEKLWAGAACAPCFKQTCEDGSCMRDITPEAVFAAVRRQAGGRL